MFILSFFLEFFQAFIWILNNFRSIDIYVKISTDIFLIFLTYPQNRITDIFIIGFYIRRRLGSEDGKTKSGDFLPYVGVKTWGCQYGIFYCTTLVGAKKSPRTIGCERLDLSHPLQYFFYLIFYYNFQYVEVYGTIVWGENMRGRVSGE